MTLPESPETLKTRSPNRLDIPADDWRRISGRYTAIELIGSLVTVVIIAAAATAAIMLFDWPVLLIGGIAGVIVLAQLIYAAFTPRRVRSIQYRLRSDDLLFRRGIMWQRFVAVPYGRMQLVDITRGPVARSFGLAELRFVTASAGTNVDIPGLPIAEAEELRDHLVRVAESRRSGL